MAHSHSNAEDSGGRKTNVLILIMVIPLLALSFVFFAWWLDSDGEELVREETAAPRSHFVEGRNYADNGAADTGTDLSSLFRLPTIRARAEPQPVGCTQPAESVPVPYGGPNRDRWSRKIYPRGGCKADMTPGFSSGLYRVQCEDMSWHIQYDAACDTYRSLRFQRTGTPAAGHENDQLVLDVPFLPNGY